MPGTEGGGGLDKFNTENKSLAQGSNLITIVFYYVPFDRHLILLKINFAIINVICDCVIIESLRKL